MDTSKVDLIIQYALAVASEADDFRDRELGPIHLLKFVYLADLAYSQENHGETFTRTPWRFHSFGPWSSEVFERLRPAVQAIQGSERNFATHLREDNFRWRVQRPELGEQIERKLPRPVARAVKHGVSKFANDTISLLHEVYRTPPMLRAAPGELLDFRPEQMSPSEDTMPEIDLPQLSKTKVKKLKALVKRRIEEKRQVKRLETPMPTPRYDEVFDKGQDWLDGLAGEPISPVSGRLRFSDKAWKSTARREPEIP